MSSCSKEVWGCITASALAVSLSSTAIASPSAPSSTAKNLISKPVFGCQQTDENPNFLNYESGQVRPLALSDDGSLLFVANTPANCLEIYSTQEKKLRRISAVQVGLEPVSVAVRNDREVWVVNHLSDSVSIIDIKGTPHIKRTLLVGDEPRDIVFAGDEDRRAFITTAHRGQNHKGFDFEDLRTPGIGRADVWVFDSKNLGDELGGTPETMLSLFSDTPRALTVSEDGKTVYAAAFLSGNQTTVIPPQIVAGKKPPPNENIEGIEAPETGLIVRYNGEKWVDELGADWSKEVLFNLPDHDVFEIDADAETPVLKRSYQHVGTTLYNMAVNPVSGAVYVSNIDARNEVRFEGPGTNSTTVRGHIAENRITVINNEKVTPVHINPHVDFSLPMGEAIPAAEKAKSLAQPMNMVVSDDGETLLMSAFGSNRIALIDAKALDKGEYTPDASKQITVPGGPTGVLLSNNGKRAYVYSRYDNVVSTIKLKQKKVVATTALYNPEPAIVKDGRPFLYDATLTSSNGTASCGSCHIFGDMDALAWDLGNPDDVMADNLLDTTPGNVLPRKETQFHPMKGPMTTQTFRGIADSGPMHWRGDRQGLDAANDETQEKAAFKEFSHAFVGLVGRQTELDEHDLDAFTDFALTITSSPNPIRNLDNSLTPNQQAGRDTFFNENLDGGVSTCNSCHTLDESERKFGTDGLIANAGPFISQDFKVAQLRNMYNKVGMFGTPQLSDIHMGDQVRGFGFLHDGMFASMDDFLILIQAFFWKDDNQAMQVSDFLMVFDTENLPIEGQQITMSRDNQRASRPRVELLLSQAKQGSCSLVASGLIGKKSYYGTYGLDGKFHAKGFPAYSEKKLRRLSKKPKQQMTYTCLPNALAAS
ncbi:cytochrome c peroxidase [Sinobacterium caligoides]|uniref:Cytochrome c peroxidase n=1 Tax=Sinobacterium caligoides TaxID=933926 RepID=A0A3N2DQF2_9GAMM|nr:hypothetical protein [Sinobacterium caligoides]ROS02020.1 cytochrome c peroxidase [Sinobacterium caligoides]